MKHDILFALLTPQSEKLLIEAFTFAEYTMKFLHPGERKILTDIVKVAKQYQSISKFSKTYGVSLKGNIPTTDTTEEPLQRGLYLQAFADGIEKILGIYIQKIVELERKYLQNPSHSLLFIYHNINAYQILFTYLQRLIDGIRTQKLHGCAIIQYLHQNMLHGNKEITEYMKIIFTSVNTVFLKQLAHWILYGKVLDTYGEFFIQSYEYRNNTAGCNSLSSSGRNAAATASTADSTSTYAEVWRYDICNEFFPYYLPYSWAEKVLFIGQTVLMFKVGVNKTNKKNTDWNETDKNSSSVSTAATSALALSSSPLSAYSDSSLWDNQEHKFLKMIQSLQDTEDDDVVVSNYEKVITDIKSYVTEKLSQIAVKQADLIKQLKLIKDFYLLGRGELFLEFIRKTYSLDKLTAKTLNENNIRDLVKAFDTAANSLNITDDLESFSLSFCKNKIHTFDIDNFTYFQNICLEYKIEWPLHLIFSPKVIERYNELFRFLLLVKKIQYELHMIWALNRKQNDDQERIKLMHLLHQLMFLIDNLQYYIQVDVLESQFSILMNSILNSSDFENIQRAHSIFHANVLSLCFLLSNDDEVNTQTSIIQCSENPVLSLLSKIFHLCEVFCSFANSCLSPLSKDAIDKIDLLQTQLLELIKELMDLLIGLKAAPNSTPLSQLLLRLDFNYWFSRNED